MQGALLNLVASASMQAQRQIGWRVAKILLAVAIIASVSWHFANILAAPELWQAEVHLHGGWSVLCGVLYLLALACSACFWYWLMRVMGAHPSPWATMRAYYIGQFGRYIPGK